MKVLRNLRLFPFLLCLLVASPVLLASETLPSSERAGPSPDKSSTTSTSASDSTKDRNDDSTNKDAGHGFGAGSSAGPVKR